VIAFWIALVNRIRNSQTANSANEDDGIEHIPVFDSKIELKRGEFGYYEVPAGKVPTQSSHGDGLMNQPPSKTS
jgi:hypothetical protein